MAFSSQIIPVKELNPLQIRTMYGLLELHFANTTWDRFCEDLLEKTWVILLQDAGKLVGFSTQHFYEINFEGEILQIVFSGDTLIDPTHWGSPELQWTFARLLEKTRIESPNRRLFWFLISKGFRTYRIMSIYFREFFPRYDAATPDWHHRLLNHLAHSRFPTAFREDRGILDFHGQSQFLKSHLAFVPEGKSEANPHVRFFLNANPGWKRGDELVCLAEYSPRNWTAYLTRRITALAQFDCRVQME
jgi:hypothetical protein